MWPQTAFPWGQGPRDLRSALVLTARFPGRVLMVELPCGGDEIDSSTQVPVCQACVGTSRQVLSYLALSGIDIRGPQFSGHSLGT
jgi:hypothetical protein